MPEVRRRFDNEAGNAVNIRVFEDAGAVVCIMRDDRSCMENIITQKEAEELHAALGDFFNLQRPAETKEPT